MTQPSTAERDRRWAKARKAMAKHDVDVLVAYSDFGDQSTLQRYFTNYRSSYDYVASLFYRDESKGCDLILTHPGGIPIGQQLSWATEVLATAVPDTMAGHNSGVRPSIGGQVANRVTQKNANRVGVLGMEYFPAGWSDLIRAANPDVEFVEMWQDIHHQRLVKSPEEVALVREACRISDVAWSHVPEFVRPGRKRYEVLADIEHILRLEGCEDSFNMCMAMPMLQEKLDRSPYSALPIEEDSVYMLEISPRYLGYFGQQTNLVSTGAMPSQMQTVHQAVTRARDAALKIVKPGVDLTEMEAAIAQQFASEGLQPASSSFGHAVGMELEDQHINGSSLVLEEGMTFIFHPMAAGNPAVMRADTYVITANGYERLTTGDPAAMVL